MTLAQEAEAITQEFKEIEAEYCAPDSQIDSGNWYYISKKQNDVIVELMDRIRVLEEMLRYARLDVESEPRYFD